MIIRPSYGFKLPVHCFFLSSRLKLTLISTHKIPGNVNAGRRSQTDQSAPPSTRLAGRKGTRGAPLFSLRFSYYTEISAAELLRTLRRLRTQGEPQSPGPVVPLPVEPVSINSDGVARDAAHLFSRINKLGAAAALGAGWLAHPAWRSVLAG